MQCSKKYLILFALTFPCISNALVNTESATNSEITLDSIQNYKLDALKYKALIYTLLGKQDGASEMLCNQLITTYQEDDFFPKAMSYVKEYCTYRKSLVRAMFRNSVKLLKTCKKMLKLLNQKADEFQSNESFHRLQRFFEINFRRSLIFRAGSMKFKAWIEHLEEVLAATNRDDFEKIFIDLEQKECEICDEIDEANEELIQLEKES